MMRKIEQDMWQAIRDGRNWKSGNTAVKVFNDGQATAIFLHGNRIATSYTLEDMRGFCPDPDTFRKWPTQTTVSRLRALGIDASIHKGLPYIDGKAC